MNHKSYTFDIDDWEIVYDKPNNKEYRYIENSFIDNIYNENWCSDINNKLLKLNLKTKEVWEDKNIKEIIEDAKKSWNEKLHNEELQNDKLHFENIHNVFYQNKYTKKRKIS